MSAEVVIPYAGAVMVWALTLYVATRGGWHRMAVLACLAMLSLTIYLIGQALANSADGIDTWANWQAFTWPGTSFGPVLWLLLTLTLVAQDAPAEIRSSRMALFWSIAGILLGLAACLAVAESAGELVVGWHAADELRRAPDGPLLGVYRVYALVCVSWAAANTVWLWRSSAPGTPLRARFGWLVASAVLFIVGLTELTMIAGIYGVPGLWGQIALIVGMLVMGWNLARYGALLAGEVAHADVIGFGLGMLAVTGVYAVVLAFVEPLDYAWLERTLLGLMFIMLTHVLMSRRSQLVDRILYGPMASALSGQLRALADRVVRQPDPVSALAEVTSSIDDMFAHEQPPTELELDSAPLTGSVDTTAAFAAEIEPLVASALKRLNDLPALSRNRLVRMLAPVGAGQTELDGAAWLRSHVIEAIERLRPPDGSPPRPGLSDGPGGWLHYLVLREAYVDGHPNREIMQRYWIGEGSFYRARSSAISTVAVHLAQQCVDSGARSVLDSDQHHVLTAS